MTELEKCKCHFIAESMGKQSQIDVAIGECAELISALEDYRRGRIDVDGIVDEIADVEVMMEQLMHIFDCTIQTKDRIAFKIHRQLERMGEENRWKGTVDG